MNLTKILKTKPTEEDSMIRERELELEREDNVCQRHGLLPKLCKSKAHYAFENFNEYCSFVKKLLGIPLPEVVIGAIVSPLMLPLMTWDAYSISEPDLDSITGRYILRCSD